MTCYVVPTAIAVLSIVYRRKHDLHSKHAQWFTMMFSGGSIFGIVDHLWNGQLLLLGPNLAQDLLLGLAITGTLLASWIVAVRLDLAKAKAEAKA